MFGGWVDGWIYYIQVSLRRCFNFAKLKTNTVCSANPQQPLQRFGAPENHSNKQTLYFNDKRTESNCFKWAHPYWYLHDIDLRAYSTATFSLSPPPPFIAALLERLRCETIIRYSAVSILRLERTQSTGQNPNIKTTNCGDRPMFVQSCL